MRKITPLFFIFLLVAGYSCTTITPPAKEFNPIRESSQRNANRDRNFDHGWKFKWGDIADAHLPGKDDNEWRNVTLPHDWSIEDLPNQEHDSVIGPFTSESEGGPSTGHVRGGTGWYRKAFTLDPGDQGQQVIIRFDGAYMESEVWINGHTLGTYPNGYLPFHYDITPFLKTNGQANVIAVKVNNLGENSRWYSGSGIYRHVWLTVVDPLHFDVYGVNVITSSIKDNNAQLIVRSDIRNDSDAARDITYLAEVYNPTGRKVASVQSGKSLESGVNTTLSLELEIDDPALWSPESPNLNVVDVSILEGDKVLDKYSQTFGIRTVAYNVEEGLLVNGQSYLIKGGCVHHDNGPLGAAALDKAEYRRVALLKKYGFNGIRTAHNPPSPQFLDACDELGMLVIDEAFDMWEVPKKPADYSNHFKEWWKKDLQSFVKRDRNHPSVIVWSIGNEIYERTDSAGLVWTKLMVDAVKEEDNSRPVTEALCLFWQRPGKPWADNYPGFQLLDVGGYNYEWERYEEDHEAMPDLVMIGTESLAKDAYESWEAVEKLPYVIGDFVWTAMDYFGESGIGSALNEPPKPPLDWPWFNGFCGDIDVIGNKKPQSHYRDVVWRISNIEMAVHAPIPDGEQEYVTKWGWPDERQSWSWEGHEGKLFSVNVYSRHPDIQLKLNGKVVGEVKSKDTLTTTFMVPYEAGTLTAIASKDGKIIDSVSFATVKVASQITLEADQPMITTDFNDLVYVAVTVADEDGNRVPYFEETIRFDISGAGELAAVGNGNPVDMKSFQQPYVRAYRGRCLVILRSGGKQGEIILTARGEGLNDSSLRLQSE